MAPARPPQDTLARAAALYGEGRAGAGAALLDAALAARPGDVRLHFEAAALADRAGQHARAQSGYEHVLQLMPGALPAWLNLGSLHLRLDHFSAAEECFRRAAAAGPRVADARLGLGYALLRQERLAEAVAAFAEAAHLDSGRADALANLGAARLKMGQTMAAIADFERALALWPGNPDLLCSLGIAQQQASQPQAAARTLDTLLAAEPGHARALGTRAAVAVQLQEVELAARLLDADRLLHRPALDLPPGYAGWACFNAALSAAAEDHPTLVRNREGKTTRHGGQTGNLADDPDPALRALIALVRRALAEFLAASGAGGRPWRLNIWATVLDREGHQATHNHPGGVASGVYYARVPAPIGTPEGGDTGFIEFGRPPPELGPADPRLIRTLCPEEGQMLLFPSHLWHRTIAFVADRPRISIAFDAVATG